MAPTSAALLFQSYILPVIPFRRRHSSNTSSSTVASDDSEFSTSSTSSASPPVLSPNPSSTISCAKCHAELALTSQIISKGFTGRHGRAYLVSASDPTSILTFPTAATARPSAGHVGPRSADFPIAADPLNAHPNSTCSSTVSTLPNTYTGKPVPRNLVTGLHTVCDVSCAMCCSVLGWKYVGAEENAQRYKVGKFILETRRTVLQHFWEARSADDEDESGGVGKGAGMGEVIFDSADEDECEDLFAGVWSQGAVRRRRARRFAGLRG